MKDEKRRNNLATYTRIMGVLKSETSGGKTPELSNLAKKLGLEQKILRNRINYLRVIGVNIPRFAQSHIRADIWEEARRLGFQVTPKTKTK